jgi:hypothetical protein
MYVMQATFRAKPGKAQALADKLAAASSKNSDGRVKRSRVLIDHVADFWTVVFEASFESLDDYFAVLSQPEVRAEMEGYLDLVDSGNRRMYRMVAER